MSKRTKILLICTPCAINAIMCLIIVGIAFYSWLFGSETIWLYSSSEGLGVFVSSAFDKMFLHVVISVLSMLFTFIILFELGFKIKDLTQHDEK